MQPSHLQAAMSAAELAQQHPQAASRAAAGCNTAVASARAADPSGSSSVVAGAKVIAGAAAVGGLAVGAAAGSVALGVLGAGAGAYAATRSDGVGQAARSTGQAAVVVGGKAKQVNREHHLTERASSAFSSGLKAVKAVDAKHNITGKTWSALKGGAAKAAEINQKHDLTGKATAGITSAAQGLTRAVQGSSNGPPPPPPPPPPEGHVGTYRLGAAAPSAGPPMATAVPVGVPMGVPVANYAGGPPARP